MKRGYMTWRERIGEKRELAQREVNSIKYARFNSLNY